MKAILASLAVAAALVSTGALASTTVFDFRDVNIDLGPTKTYSQMAFTTGGNTVPVSFTASGFDQFNNPVDLFGKNTGPTEFGLGLVNDPSGEHEISFGNGYVQFDVGALIGVVSPGSVFFDINSATNGEQWSVYGSNAAHTIGTLLVSGDYEGGHLLPDFGVYRYYDFVSTSDSGGKNFLISRLFMSPVPEPMTWALMLAGVLGVGVALRRSAGPRGRRSADLVARTI